MRRARLGNTTAAMIAMMASTPIISIRVKATNKPRAAAVLARGPAPACLGRARALLVRRRALMAGLTVVSFRVEQAHDGQEYRQRQQAHQDDQTDDHHRLHHREQL